MKYLTFFCLLSSIVFGQWVVNDPVNTAVNTAIQADQQFQHLETLRQWTQQLNRLNDQLRELEEAVRLQRRIRDVLGDPLQAGTELVLRNLGAEELGQSYGDTLREIRRLADASTSLRYTAEGIYGPLGNRTSLRATVTRHDALYRRFAAVEQQAEQSAQAQETAAIRMAALHDDLAAAMTKLRTASTAAEVDKLNATIAALNGQLAVTAAERANETAKVAVQNSLNVNQTAKERQDLLERQVTEERQTLTAIGEWQAGLSLSSLATSTP